MHLPPYLCTMARTKSFNEQAVLENARKLFWERGYEASSIQELERATGLSRSSIYRFFGGKRALFDRTLQEYQRENMDWLAAHFRQSSDFKTALRQYFLHAVQAMAPEGNNCSLGCYIVNVTTELAAVDAKAFAFVANNRERFMEIMIAAIEKAKTAGQLSSSTDPEAISGFLFTSNNGLQVVVKTGIGREALGDIIELIIESVFTSK